jgi:hypothetical protein
LGHLLTRGLRVSEAVEECHAEGQGGGERGCRRSHVAGIMRRDAFRVNVRLQPELTESCHVTIMVTWQKRAGKRPMSPN